MAGITVPTRRQLSNLVPLTRPTSFQRSVGMTRTLSISKAQEIADQAKSGGRAFFRMKLDAKDVVPFHHRHEFTAIGRGAAHHVRPSRLEVIAVNKIEIRPVGNAIQEL